MLFCKLAVQRIAVPFFVFLALLVSTTSLVAQGYQSFFFNSFTDIQRLDFSTDPPTATATGIAGSYEGITHFEDGAGNLLFMFNANGLYDANVDYMPGSTGIFANSSSAEILSCPVPGQPGKYYVIYNEETCSNLYYSIVNMELNGGLGDAEELNVLIDSSNFSEGMEIVKRPGTNEYWILAYECGTGFKRFLINEDGIDNGEVMMFYDMPGGTYDGRGEMDYHAGKVGACFAWSSQVLLYDFDPVTGSVANPVELSSPQFNNSPFGVDFSEAGDKMFFSLWYTTGMNNIFMYDIATDDLTAYAPDLGGSVTGLGEIELGPDGRLYVVIDDGDNILVIETADGCEEDPCFDLIPISAKTGLGISDPIQSLVMNPLIGIEEDTPNASVFSLTPNPAKDYFFLSSDFAAQSENLILQLFDAKGRLQLSENITSNDQRIELEQLNSGIYFYSIQQGEQQLQSGKLVVQ